MSTSFPPIIHMFSTGRFRRGLCASFLVLAAVQLTAQQAPDAALYRLFLRDGSTLLSYGEFARVSDRVVISVPLGATPAGADLHLVSIPADTVDWEKTDAYVDSVRAARYAATRGPDDFALLSAAVSNALSDIGLTIDPQRKIAMAAEARQSVTRWIAEHYGYRAEDAARMATLFDDVVAEARLASGAPNFDLSLIANLAAPPAVPELPPPTLRDGVEQAVRAAALAPDASERTSLLQAIDRTLVQAGATGAEWVGPLRARVTAALAIETRAARGYADLTRGALRTADRYAQAGDVTGVERVIRRTLGEDDRLGQRRPQEMASLLAMLDGRLDAARRLRLARDNWAGRAEAWRRYQLAVAEPLAIMLASRDVLDQIRRLAGPSRLRLEQLTGRVTQAATLVAQLVVPAEGAEGHDLLRNAIQLASRAADGRLRAIAAADMQRAWEASSAASGALMLLDRASEALKNLQALPKAPR
jgi:hypothetical protein